MGKNKDRALNGLQAAYRLVYGAEPPPDLKGRITPGKKWRHLNHVDESLPESWLSFMNDIHGIEIVSTETGKSKERIAHLIFYFSDKTNDGFINLFRSHLENIFKIPTDPIVRVGVDIGNRRRPRIVLAGAVRENTAEWSVWWWKVIMGLFIAASDLLKEGQND